MQRADADVVARGRVGDEVAPLVEKLAVAAHVRFARQRRVAGEAAVGDLFGHHADPKRLNHACNVSVKYRLWIG